MVIKIDRIADIASFSLAERITSLSVADNMMVGQNWLLLTDLTVQDDFVF